MLPGVKECYLGRRGDSIVEVGFRGMILQSERGYHRRGKKSNLRLVRQACHFQEVMTIYLKSECIYNSRAGWRMRTSKGRQPQHAAAWASVGVGRLAALTPDKLYASLDFLIPTT
jgi:hypothetical protein